jgi:hypothetical protein
MQRKNRTLLNFSLGLGLALALGAGDLACAASGNSTATYHSHSSAVAIDFSGGLINSNGSYGGSFLAGVNLAVGRSSPVRLGLDSGIMFTHGVALPVLLSILYNFQNYSNSVTPYVAGTVGPIIGLSSTSINIDGVNVPTSYLGDGVKLGIFVRPGLRFNLTELLDFVTEVSVGGITGFFYICPTIGIQLRV